MHRGNFQEPLISTAVKGSRVGWYSPPLK
uniref:Uncharacterized protein n=1 Tax=Arundo donax TaxID=35708 RepID=A0A0A8ZDC6_ARUDO